MSLPALSNPDRRIYFYHSFPRHHRYDDAQKSLALRTLGSILKHGLLLTAEEFPQSLGFPAVEYVQKRACFTALHPGGLRKHCRRFGSFSLEFSGETLRAFGALPAFYLTAPLPGIELLNQAGTETAFHLYDAYVFLHALWELRDKSVDELAAEAKGLGNTIDAKALDDFKRKAIEVTNGLWQSRFPNHAFQHLVFGLQTLLNLYYPTEVPGNSPLQFYEQREWKIIPNFAYQRIWHYPELTPEQKADVTAINPPFFQARIAGQPRIDQCALLRLVGDRNIVDEANRIIVPDGFEKKAEALIAEARANGTIKADIPVVNSDSLPSEPPPDDDGELEPCRTTTPARA